MGAWQNSGEHQDERPYSTHTGPEILPPEGREEEQGWYYQSPEPEYTPPVEPKRRSRWAYAPATYVLVGINCFVFLVMLLTGGSALEPTLRSPLFSAFALNGGVVLYYGEWWRLFTATFTHVGWIHLLSNMWCLWNLGLLGEPLLGPMGLIAVYMLTGIAGNLLSTGVNVVGALLRHGPMEFFVGAGASGAVFGIAGILIVLLSNRKLPIPWYELKRLRRSVIWFAVLNLLIGIGANFTSIVRVDNFAHLGGFLSGLAMGVPLLPRMMSGRTRYLQRQKVTFTTAAFGLALFGYWIASLR